MLRGFRDFILRGNIVDLAVAVVIGTAFTALVTSFTSNFINPLLNALGGSSPGDALGFYLRSGNDKTFIGIGDFLGAVVNFVIIAAVVYFFVVVPVNKLLELRRRGEVEEVQATPEDIALLQEIRDLLAAGRRP